MHETECITECQFFTFGTQQDALPQRVKGGAACYGAGNGVPTPNTAMIMSIRRVERAINPYEQRFRWVFPCFCFYVHFYLWLFRSEKHLCLLSVSQKFPRFSLPPWYNFLHTLGTLANFQGWTVRGLIIRSSHAPRR